MNTLNRKTEEFYSPPMYQGNRRLELMRKMEKALNLAEQNAEAASARRAQIRGVVADELYAKYTKVTKSMMDEHTDIRCSSDKVYKNFIGQNQWQMQQAIMYSGAVTAYNTLILTRPFMSPETLAEMGISPASDPTKEM